MVINRRHVGPEMTDEILREERRLLKVAAREQLRRAVHDYDNVLAVIGGSIELALRKIARGDPADAERQLRRAIEAIKRGGALSANLIAFSGGCDATPTESGSDGRADSSTPSAACPMW